MGEPVDFGAITFNADGTIRITLEDGAPPIVLRRPKLGPLRQWHLSVHAMQAENLAALRQAADTYRQTTTDLEQTAGSDLTAARREAVDAREAGVLAADQAVFDFTVKWMRDVVAELGDRALPEDYDDWPGELVLGFDVLKRFFDCWFHNPSDRGRAGRPATTGTIR